MVSVVRMAVFDIIQPEGKIGWSKHPRGGTSHARQSRYGKKVNGGRMLMLVGYATVHPRYYIMKI